MPRPFFNDNIDLVPKLALTVGVGTVLSAREVVIVATGEKKAAAVARSVEGSVNHMWTLSALQLHPHAMLICDEPACSDLTFRTLRYFMNVEADNIDSPIFTPASMAGGVSSV